MKIIRYYKVLLKGYFEVKTKTSSRGTKLAQSTLQYKLAKQKMCAIRVSYKFILQSVFSFQPKHTPTLILMSLILILLIF